MDTEHEPPLQGSAVFHTSEGDIEIAFWPQAAPKAVENFCTLIHEGYFNGTLFHRIVPGVALQGGTRPGSTDGACISSTPLTLELSPRLKFRSRGLLAVAANPGSSEFFISLDATRHLDGEHTIFGRVQGSSMYNVMELASAPVDADGTPMRPLRVLSAELRVAPMQIQPRSSPSWRVVPEVPTLEDIAARQAEKEKAQRMRSSATLGMSFGAGGSDSSSDDDGGVPAKRVPARKAHAMPVNPAVFRSQPPAPSAAPAPALPQQQQQQQHQRPMTTHPDMPARSSSPLQSDVAAVKSAIAQRLADAQAAQASRPPNEQPVAASNAAAPSAPLGSSHSSSPPADASKIAARRAAAPAAPVDTMARLAAFTSKLAQANTGNAPSSHVDSDAELYRGQVEEDSDGADDDWMHQPLVFRQHVDDKDAHELQDDDFVMRDRRTQQRQPRPRSRSPRRGSRHHHSRRRSRSRSPGRTHHHRSRVHMSSK